MESLQPDVVCSVVVHTFALNINHFIVYRSIAMLFYVLHSLYRLWTSATYCPYGLLCVGVLTAVIGVALCEGNVALMFQISVYSAHNLRNFGLFTARMDGNRAVFFFSVRYL